MYFNQNKSGTNGIDQWISIIQIQLLIVFIRVDLYRFLWDFAQLQKTEFLLNIKWFVFPKMYVMEKWSAKKNL
jgi:hypothetical protein